jgi:TRAP-type transport system periplasmic protein
MPHARTMTGGILAALMVGATLLAPTSGIAADWNLASVLPDGNFQLENAKAFAAAVRDATAGEVNITGTAAGRLATAGRSCWSRYATV